LRTRSIAAEFTVSDFVRGWDDVRQLLTATDADQVWEAVALWPPQRLATALVARPDELAAGPWPDWADVAVTGQVSGVRASGHVAGQLAAPARSR
jgi:hypothetical protein